MDRRNYSRQKKGGNTNKIVMTVTAVVAVGIIIAIILLLKSVFFPSSGEKVPISNIIPRTESSGETSILTPSGLPVNSDPSEAESSEISSEPESSEESSEPEPVVIDPLHFIAPNPDDPGGNGYEDGGLFVWGGSIYETFFGTEGYAEYFAEVINSAGDLFDSDVKIYSAIIPSHIEMNVPERLKNTPEGIYTKSQLDYIKAAYEAMEDPIIPVNIYNKLAENCNKYVYFHSDHHWTALGAYYAYTAFAEAANLPVLSLDDCEEVVLGDYYGSLTAYTSASHDTDNVHYWKFPYETPTDIYLAGGGSYETESCINESLGESFPYGVFLSGDQPLEVIHSKSPMGEGKKILVVHESYGNPFVPYLTYNFSEVYSIDYRYWSGGLRSFCEEYGIDNVLFLNCTMGTVGQPDDVRALLYY
ncbi:MAG: hypothetical protein II713_02735 [Clostridia bacterium]|nr:hypothetical protein [Clostridia bacterium]